MIPAFLGLSGLVLTDAERGLIREANPAGFCLFGRNVRDRVQLRALTDALRDLSGRADLPILVDQEGGRVARLRPPEWPEFPAAARFAALYEKTPMSAIGRPHSPMPTANHPPSRPVPTRSDAPSEPRTAPTPTAVISAPAPGSPVCTVM